MDTGSSLLKLLNVDFEAAPHNTHCTGMRHAELVYLSTLE